MCIIFIGSAFIDTETCPLLLLQIFSGMYSNQTYGFASPAALWKFVTRVPVFVISPGAINTLIGFKAFHQVIQGLNFIGKCRPKGHKISLG